MSPYLDATLLANPGASLLCENISAYPDDLNVRDDVSVVTFKREVYHVCRSPILSKDSVVQIVRKANTYRFWGWELFCLKV